MRLFISLNLKEETRRELAELQARFKAEAESRYPGSIKWDKPENFHMTLFFIGEADKAMAEKISGALREVKEKFPGKQFDFISNSISGFPNLRKPRVVFASAENPAKEVFTLSYEIRKCMEAFGFKDEKPFHPHITLGRVRRDRRINLQDIKTGKFQIEFTCKEFYLMESKLSPGGSNYKIVEAYCLTT
jgi:2'-5' RNA ligase